MNKVFKVIWNTATQSYSVVSELSRAKGKPTKLSVLSKAIALALSVVGVTSAYAAEMPDTYFHVNTGAADQPAGNATTNEGSIDSKAGATGDRSIAVGMNARAEGISSISIGRDASNSQASANAIAIGRNAQNTGNASRSVTIGENALSEESNTSVTIGYGAKTTMNSLPDPEKTSLGVGGWAVAIGRNATMAVSLSVLEQKQPPTLMALTNMVP
ncbi:MULTISPECIES: ESPR-type extended signal peptide-containing protein [unclassified Mannheimia]|uniref:ESPR-type extended signal peptide-containing protein n=1 Tax=unclassified Mannheimia TaxID=2645054 RepID=UPI00359CCFF3